MPITPCCVNQNRYKAEDTQGRKPAPNFGVENWNQLLECVSCRNGSDFRLRLERVLFRGRFSEARDRQNRCDWLKFIVFIWLVCKQCRIGENTFLLRFLLPFTIFSQINASAATASSSSFSVTSAFVADFWGRKSTHIFDSKNRSRKSAPAFDPVCLEPKNGPCRILFCVAVVFFSALCSSSWLCL